MYEIITCQCLGYRISAAIGGFGESAIPSVLGEF